jgi:hypothetical protein
MVAANTGVLAEYILTPIRLTISGSNDAEMFVLKVNPCNMDNVYTMVCNTNTERTGVTETAAKEHILLAIEMACTSSEGEKTIRVSVPFFPTLVLPANPSNVDKAINLVKRAMNRYF